MKNGRIENGKQVGRNTQYKRLKIHVYKIKIIRYTLHTIILYTDDRIRSKLSMVFCTLRIMENDNHATKMLHFRIIFVNEFQYILNPKR